MRERAKSNRQYPIHAFAAGATIALTAVFCFVSGFSLIIPVILLFAGLHLRFFKKAQPALLLHLGLLLALLIFIANFVIEYDVVSPLYIPVASIAILTILLFKDLQLAFLMSVATSTIAGLMLGGNLSLTLTFFFGSLIGVYSVKDSRTRGELINAGFFVGCMQVLAIALLYPSADFVLTKDFVMRFLRPLLINGFISVGIVMFTLKVFESIFKVTTNFSLLEMSDFNHPLLKRMVLEAPGTYHHSLIVSNLAEAAADAIGANALLARVGAYYHDIGKLNKPEYFTENQLVEGSKHDNLEPSMSRLVILNHVKDGLEIAQKYKLNPLIVDFILQHHGTSLMYYFYQRAVETADRNEKVEEQDFRYPGPRPTTRETAIVMLADSAEGAVRSLEEQTPVRINDVVRKIVNNKFIDGQLDECALTLRDLERISATFSRVLSAMYHSRIKYPESKKDADTDSNQPLQPNPADGQPPEKDRPKSP